MNYTQWMVKESQFYTEILIHYTLWRFLLNPYSYH
jgi:hypothetical protein